MTSEPEAQPPLLLDLAATVEHLADARAAVRQWLERERVERPAADDLVSVASEFFLHVVVRTGGTGRARVRAERGPGGVRLSVTTATIDVRSPEVRSIDLPPDPLRAGSLGRRLVDGSCDGVEISEGEGDLRIECWRSVRSA